MNRFEWAGEIFDDGSRDDKWVCGEVFISKRDYFNGFPKEHYQVYRAVDRVPAGRMPWTINNRRLHTAPIFTLEEAMQFGLEQSKAAA